MADPATMMLVGAGLGAASNKDDPFKGAMMGAALGGLGGAGYGAFTGGAGAAAGAAEAAGAAGAAAAPVVEPGMLSSAMGGVTPASVATAFPVSTSPFAAPSVLAGDTLGAALYGLTPEQIATSSVPSEVGMRGDISWMDMISPSQQAAIGTGALPGATGINPMSAMAAQSLLRPPEQPQMGGGGARRGDPRALSDAVISLLAPKQISKRKISLL